MSSSDHKKYYQVQLSILTQLQENLGPIDLQPLKALIEEEDTQTGSSGTKKSYTDFLLPLPDHLQPAEIGIPDVAVIKQSRAERGMNTDIAAASKKDKLENELKNTLKNNLKNTPKPGQGPAPKRKRTYRPNPFSGTSETIIEE